VADLGKKKKSHKDRKRHRKEHHGRGGRSGEKPRKNANLRQSSGWGGRTKRGNNTSRSTLGFMGVLGGKKGRKNKRLGEYLATGWGTAKKANTIEIVP